MWCHGEVAQERYMVRQPHVSSHGRGALTLRKALGDLSMVDRKVRGFSRQSIPSRVWNIAVVVFIVLMIASVAVPFVFRTIRTHWMYRRAETLIALGARPTYAVHTLGKWGFACANPDQVTDKTISSWLPHLHNLGSIYQLVLSDTHITDASMSTIAELTDIRLLYLENTAISDEGIRHLPELRRLELVDLSGTQITDDGLRYLTDCRELRALGIEHTDVTPSAVSAFRDKRPDVTVWSGE